MVTQENQVAGLFPSSPGSSTKEMTDLNRSVSQVHLAPSPMAFLDPHQALALTFTNRFLDHTFSPEADAVAVRGDFVSTFPLFFRPPSEEEEKEGFDSSASSGALGWSVEQIGGVVVVAVIVPFILVSNLLVMVSVSRFKRLQMPTNYFVVSLAAVDVFVAVITPFFIVIEVLPGQVDNPVLCLSPNRILMTACGVSVLTLAAVAYDRHTALVNPLKYVSVMTPRKITFMVTFIWLYSASIIWAPLLLGWYSTVSSENVDTTTTPRPCSFQLLHDRAHVLFLSAIFGPACVAISVCYFRIYTVARQHARAIAAVENSVHHHSLRVRFMMKDAKYAKTLALVIGVFLVLWTPYLACLLAEVITSVRVTPWLWNYLTLLAVLNSGLNPWIYAFKNNDFREAFRKTLKACCSVCCRIGSGRFCCPVFKKTRRSKALSDVNLFNATTTSTSQSRSSRLNHGSMTAPGRLSDVSCIVSVGMESTENINKAFSLNHRGSVVSTIRRSSPTEIDSDAFLRSAADSTEKRMSTLLNEDSRAFIEDLLSLHLHHTLAHKHMHAESLGDVAEKDITDQWNPNSDDLSDHLNSYDSDQTDHIYHRYHADYTHRNVSCEHSHRGDTDSFHHSDSSDYTYPTNPTQNYQGCHTELHYHNDHVEIYPSDYTDSYPSHSQSYQSDHTEQSYHSDQTESYHCDCADHTYHNDYTVSHSEHTNSNHSNHNEKYHHGHADSYQCKYADLAHHTDHTESYHSDHAESYHSDHAESYQSYHTESYQYDHTESYQSDHTDHAYHSDHAESYQSDHTESYQSDHTDHAYHSDHAESYQSDHTDHAYHSDHPESYHDDDTDHVYHTDQPESYHSDHIEKTYHSGHTEKTYHNDHTEKTYHSGHTEKTYHSDHTEKTYHSGHTEKTYYSDHTEKTYHNDYTEKTSQRSH